MCVLVCWSDQNPCPNPEAETHPDHRTVLIQTQHSARASPKGIWKQTEGRGRRKDGRKKGEGVRQKDRSREDEMER